MVKLIGSGQAIALVGSGCSAQVGYDTWERLIGEIEELCSRLSAQFVPDPDRRNLLLDYAQDLKDALRKADNGVAQYFKLLHTRFSPNSRSFAELHTHICKLPFRGILTTNYDGVLECALSQLVPGQGSYTIEISDMMRAGVSEFLLALVDDSAPRKIAHLHGYYERPHEIVLTREDYEAAYGFSLGAENSPSSSEIPLRHQLLWSLLAMRRVVFLGFGMHDPFLMEMLASVANDLWRWDGVVHYALMDITRDNADEMRQFDRKLRERYAVGVVFYERPDETFAGLGAAVAEIAGELSIDPGPRWWEDSSEALIQRRRRGEPGA